MWSEGTQRMHPEAWLGIKHRSQGVNLAGVTAE
jgi:hypothetical protein